MKAYKKPLILTVPLSARLTDSEAERAAERARAKGLTRSEWGRSVILDALGTPLQAECPDWARLMLGEFLALRSVVVDLQRDLIQGVKPTTERVKAILETADQRKLALADGRLLTIAPLAKEKDQ